MRAQTPEPGDAPAEILGDPSAETITSLREALVDGFSCGHADALSTEEEMEEHLGKGDSAGEVVILTTFDRRAATAAERAAATRGVPKGYRDVWCRPYGQGAAMAHTEIVLRWRERAEVGA